MLISSKQIHFLNKALIDGFENRLLDHVKRCFPRKCAGHTDAEIRKVIRHGMQKARGYGFDNELEICKYINLMFLFGGSFDTQKEPWASICRKAGDRRTFQQNWDECYDALIAQSTKARP